MIVRKPFGASELEYAVVSEGFVVLSGSQGSFRFEDAPYESNLGLHPPIMHIFKATEEFPLVLNSTPGETRILPKRDFDAIHDSAEEIESRFLAEWESDNDAYNGVMFALVPFEARDDRKGFVKIGYVPAVGEFSDTSLLYADRVLYLGGQLASSVMPSLVPRFVCNWLSSSHTVQAYDDKKYDCVNVGKIEIPADAARELTLEANNLLEERFGEKLLLRG